MKRILTVLVGVCLWGGCVLAGPQAPAGGPRKPGAAPKRKGLVQLPHLRVDLVKREVIFDANVCLRKGFLELLVCRRPAKGVQSKEHESILSTDARGADIHAALMLLGLTRGKPAELMPAREGQRGVALPPRGPELKVILRWKDADGKQHQAEPAKWLAAPKGRKQPPTDKWVFVGSEIMPDGKYWADSSGDIISLSNFASAVIDVPFKSTSVNDFLEFITNAEAIPPKGTRVEVVLTPLPGAAGAEHARALLEIDRFGQLKMEGKPLLFDKLTEWGEAYVKRQRKGRVVIRSAPRAISADVERVRTELRFGGIEDIRKHRLVPAGAMLPRTPAQAGRALTQYRKLFADFEWAIPDPVEAAEGQLKEIEWELRELKRLESLWKEYRAHLKGQLDKHRASTRPTTKPAPAKRQE